MTTNPTLLDELQARLCPINPAEGQGYFLPRPELLKETVGDLLRVVSVPSAIVTKKPATAVLQPMLSAMYAQAIPVLFALRRVNFELEVLLGTCGKKNSYNIADSLLSGHLPGIVREQANSSSLLTELFTWNYGTAIVGIPSQASNPLSHFLQGIEASDWLYLVLGLPIHKQDIRNAISQLAYYDQHLTNLYLRQGTVEATNQPIAARLHKMLKMSLNQYYRGTTLGMWQVRAFFLTKQETTLHTGSALLVSGLAGKQSLPRPITLVPCPLLPSEGQNTLQYNYELNTPDLCQFIHLPSVEQPGYSLRPTPQYGQSPPKTDGPAIDLGHLETLSGVKPQPIQIKVDALLRHMFITGITGSGKTKTAQQILIQLWQNHKIPFLVIEPAKKEYRSLQVFDRLQDLLVFTLGDEREAPFRFNPLEIPHRVPAQMHLDLLRTLFQATFAGLYPPMPYLLEQAMTELYQDFGWDLAQDTGNKNLVSPTLQDLSAKATEVANRAGYDDEVTQNVRTALRVRLESLLVGSKGRLLNTRRSLPLDLLLQQPVILELSSIGDPELVAFLIGALLIRLYEHRAYSQSIQHSSHLLHVTLLEEAHRLLAHQTSQQHPDFSSIRSHSVEAFCQLLTEVRAFGEGIAVVDQSPAKLHPDILRGTNTKIIHRLLAEDDRKAVAGCTNMTEEQAGSLTQMNVQQAAVYAEGFHTPILTLVPTLCEPSDPASTSKSVNRCMRHFYEKFPLQDTERSIDRRSHSETNVTKITPAMIKHFQELIAFTPAENLWPTLAGKLKEIVKKQNHKNRDDIASCALSLGIALANRLGLPDSLKGKLKANLAIVLFRGGAAR
jgi:hypothetical protein